jgi:3-deoxy-D-manno-octulosonic-acid transferase
MSLAGIAFGTASHIAALLGHGKAKRWWHGRLNLPPKGPFDLLVHCASWGEFWMVEPLLQRWSAEGRRVLVSFFSPSGMEGWSRYQAPEGIFACLAPLDFNPYLGRFLKECEPKALLILQTDLWPGLAAQAISQKVPFGLAFAHVPRGHRWWTPLGLLDRMLLRKAAFVGLQEASGMKLALAAGLPALLLGDGRFDSAASRIARGDGPLPHWHAFADHQPLLVCGSTWAQDEDLLLPLLMRRSH